MTVLSDNLAFGLYRFDHMPTEGSENANSKQKKVESFKPMGNFSYTQSFLTELDDEGT